MADVGMDLFLPDVLVSVDQCPKSAALLAIRHACIRFCESTHIDVRDLADITIVPGTAVYDIAPPTGFDVASAISLRYPSNPEPLTPITMQQLDAIPAWEQAVGAPRYSVFLSPTTVRVWPTPAVGVAVPDPMVCVAAVKPTRAGAQVEEVVYRDYYETIVAGALARLQMMAGKPWTNPQLAAVASQMFMRGISEAKARVFNQYAAAARFVDRPTFGV